MNRLCWWLLGSIVVFEVLLAAMHVAITWRPAGTFIYETERMFDLDHEGNLSTWFSSVLFLLLAFVLAAIYCLEKLARPAKRLSGIWLLCAAGAVFLSADETARIHEWLGTLLGWAIAQSEYGSPLHNLSKFPSYYWSIIYLPLALPVSAFVGWFLWKELGKARYLPIIGMVVFLLGAVVLDYFEGAYGRVDHDHWRVRFFGVDQIMDTFIVEEMFEMLGVTLVLAGCLFHASRLLAEWLAQRLE